MDMKYVCLSFDDARSDTYDVAIPIMKKYGIKASVNVISDYISNCQNYDFKSAPKSMTWDQILQCQEDGFEVACHGKTHDNTAKDVLENIEDLRSHGIDVSNIGFASPNSCLTEDNIEETGVDQLLKNGTLRYVRSGIQVRKEGLFYMFGSVMEKVTHSKFLFWILNKRNLMRTSVLPRLYPSSAIKDYTTVGQLKHFIDRMAGGVYHSDVSQHTHQVFSILRERSLLLGRRPVR